MPATRAAPLWAKTGLAHCNKREDEAIAYGHYPPSRPRHHALYQRHGSWDSFGVDRGHAMNLPRRTFLQFAGAAVAIPAASRIANAQTYPTRPITIMVGAAAGGPTDTIARILSQHMRVSLRQAMIIENNGTAGGTIAYGRGARAAPDGYTLSLGQNMSHVLSGAVYTLSYSVQRDFEPISLISSDPLLFVARSSLPANDLNEFVRWLKANAGRQGIAVIGEPAHVAGVLLQSRMGIRWQFVPYRGSAPMMQDLVAGQLDWAIAVPDTSLPQIRAARIKVYAVTSPARLAEAPEIPTVDEVGLPKFYVSLWHGLWAPRGTPKEIVAKLNAAVISALAEPQVRQRLADIGQDIFPRGRQNPQALAELQKAEIEKWWPIIKESGIKAE
jgi:tripartite-type tricarboxylate transporter receptor subunit TctC